MFLYELILVFFGTILFFIVITFGGTCAIIIGILCLPIFLLANMVSCNRPFRWLIKKSRTGVSDDLLEETTESFCWSKKPDDPLSCDPFYTVEHGEWFEYFCLPLVIITNILFNGCVYTFIIVLICLLFIAVVCSIPVIIAVIILVIVGVVIYHIGKYCKVCITSIHNDETYYAMSTV